MSSCNRNYTEIRMRMVEEQLISRGIRDPKVIEAFQKVPRHAFIATNDPHLAYGDHPLSLGLNQTISQPYIVALMSEALELSPGNRVLEIGTGSGYQTAILADIVKSVYTVERIYELQEKAIKLLNELNYHNIYYRFGDGSKGWPEKAPFDRILVTAAATSTPDALLNQLNDKGRMIIPIGEQFSQKLILYIKEKTDYKKISMGECRFVPLIDK